MDERGAVGVATAAARLGRQEQTEPAEVGHRLVEVTGELVRLVDLGGARPDVLLGELAHGLPDHPLLVGQERVVHRIPPETASLTE